MGWLQYDGSTFELNDRLLAHLQIIISSKLRRSEPFFLTWTPTGGPAGKRHAVWIDRGVAIRIDYQGSRHPAINREWVETLALAASSSAGLHITEETLSPGPQTSPRPPLS